MVYRWSSNAILTGWPYTPLRSHLLWQGRRSDAQRIQVEVREDGTVILTGRVRSWAEWEAVERVAWCGSGATKVEYKGSIEPD
jgi:osmotically-inducible protein OsmY